MQNVRRATFPSTKLLGRLRSLGEVRNKSREGSPKSKKSKFDSLVHEAVDTALVNVLGASGAAAVKFYVDTSLIYDDPEGFSNSLGNFFGSSQQGMSLLEKRIVDSLVDLLQSEYSVSVSDLIEGQSQRTLPQLITAFRARFESSSSSSSSSKHDIAESLS